MGTWGHRAFENDGAADWVWALKEGRLTAVEAAFDEVLAADTYLEAPSCENAIAAGAALCALLKCPTGESPKGVADWVAAEKTQPSARLMDKAKKAISRILGESELRELWSESDELAKWEAEVRAILEKLPDQPSSFEKKPWWKVW